MHCIIFFVVVLDSKFEHHIVVKLLSLVFQRLSRTAESWTTDLLTCTALILKYVLDRALCMNSCIEQHNSNAKVGRVVMTKEENQLLSFSLDMASNIRRSAAKGMLNGAEWSCINVSMHLLISVLPYVRDEAVDRVISELYSVLQYFCQPYGASSSDVIKEYLLLVFEQLQRTIETNPDLEPDSAISDYNAKFAALLFKFMHFFSEIREQSLTGGNIPAHVIPILDALLGVDTCNQLPLLFQLVPVSLKASDIVSFSSAGSMSDEAKEENEEILVDIRRECNENKDSGDVLRNQSQSISSGAMQNAKSDSLGVCKIIRRTEQREIALKSWLQMSAGILLDRKDSELIRVTRSIQFYQDCGQAAFGHAEKSLRKFLTEIVHADSTFAFEWKLGHSIEGPFPGRKRSVLLRKYIDPESRKCETFDSLRDITPSLQDNLLPTTLIIPSAAVITPAIATQNWGVVDLDGSGEDGAGYGVIDVVQSEPNPNSSEESVSVNREELERVNNESIDAAKSDEFFTSSMPGSDALDDANISNKMMEEAEMRHGRKLDTGPAHSGSRRLDTSANAEQNNTVIREAFVILVTASGTYSGLLSFTSRDIWFVSSHSVTNGGESGVAAVDAAAVNSSSKLKTRRRKWSVAGITNIFLRRYRLRDTAIEVFVKSGSAHKSFFADFGHTKENIRSRNDFAKSLMAISPASAFKQSFAPAAVLRLASESGYQQKWIDGEISNFDYLMVLNTLSGRSYNDLCQYPVMPWVLSQYKEESINLKRRD